MKKYIYIILAATITFTACELVDPTQTTNPNLATENIIAAENATFPWLMGLERQTALMLNEAVVNSELISDNYMNTRTFFNQFFDALDINNADDDIDDLSEDIHRLRESAIFGINTIAPSDPSTTDDQLAEMYFYKAISHLFAGDLFVALPAVAEGPLVSASGQYDLAIADLTEAISLSTDASLKAGYNIALARAHYRKGEKTSAVAAANAAIGLDAAYVRFVRFEADNASTTDNNTMQDALHDRGSFDDLQPLPRLDFLDPKYADISASEDAPIVLVKIEEAHLILAEAAATVPAAQTNLQNLLTVINSRAVSAIDDKVEGRTDQAPGSRPDSTDIRVRASATDSFRSGLVLYRQGGTVSVPTISGTSITSGIISLTLTEDAMLELIYLMRQEVFIAEGLRMADLGVKFPVSANEVTANSNVSQNQAQIPAFISGAGDLDGFTYDDVARTATCTVNMNRVLVANKTSPFVLPFH